MISTRGATTTTIGPAVVRVRFRHAIQQDGEEENWEQSFPWLQGFPFLFNLLQASVVC